MNKSDVHDAEGLSQLARTGWFKRVHMKVSATHIDRAALRIRAQLITARVAMGNHPISPGRDHEGSDIPQSNAVR